MADLAQHREEDVYQVYGEYPHCLKCGKLAVDLHHVVGRGIKKNKEDRKMHSSIYGACPICREDHQDGKLSRESDDLLKKIYSIVENSEYERTEIDCKFLSRYSQNGLDLACKKS